MKVTAKGTPTSEYRYLFAPLYTWMHNIVHILEYMYVHASCVYMLQIFIRSLVVAGLVLDGTFIHGSHYSPTK